VTKSIATITVTESVCSNDNFCVCQLFKNVAERGRWSEMIMEAHTMYRESNTDGALLLYTLLAELGYEVAQSNVAFMLDKSMSADNPLLIVFLLTVY